MTNTHGALPHANSAGCNYEPVLHPHAPSTLCTASRHGDQIAYDTYRCRCPDARTAHRIGRGRRHLRLLRSGPALVPSVGTARRLQALAAIGYSVEDLAVSLGIRDSYIGKLQHATSRRVRRITAEKVCAFYQKHADQRGPSPHAIPYAARNGWRSPIWWDDDTIDDPTHDPQQLLEFIDGKDSFHEKQIVDNIAIERFVAGDPTVTLNRAEKSQAYQAFLSRGVSHNQAAVRLKLSGATARKLAEETSTSAPKVVRGRRDNASRAERRANATRPLTESPECPGGRLMPSIAARGSDSFPAVAG